MWSFIAKGLALTMVLGNLQITSIIYLLHKITPLWFDEPPFLEQPLWGMLLDAAPIVSVCFTVFFLWLFISARPMLTFLKNAKIGEPPSAVEIKILQSKCLKLPYRTAAIAPVFYMVGGWIAGATVIETLHAIENLAYYGAIAGGLSSFLVSPAVILGFHWMMEPVISMASDQCPEMAPARHAGYRWMTVQWKLIVVMVFIVAATSGYIAVIGYAHADVLIQNLRQIEAGMTPETKAAYASHGVSFAADYADRWGNMIQVYAVLVAIACLEAMIMAIMTSREVAGPVKILSQVAEQVRRGSYDQPARLITDDEMADLAATLNAMMGKIIRHMLEMEAVVENLRAGVKQMDESSGALQTVSVQQTSGTAQQASAIQESSSIAEEIVATAKQISSRATLMDEAAASTLESVKIGEAKLDDARAAFARISEQSDLAGSAMMALADRFTEIYRIADVVKNITEQTELLALNAALEAAGAGEHGRRFAVVAAETRRLALTSDDATGEILQLVKAIEQATVETTELARAGAERVNIGGNAIAEVVKALDSISEFAASTSNAVTEITSSTAQQTSASEQLATSIVEVHDVARQIESGAKEVEGEVHNLRELAEALQETVEEKQKDTEK